MKNLVLTAALGYAPRLLVPLLESTRRHVPDTAVFILVRPSQLSDCEPLIARYPFAKTIPVKTKRGRHQLFWTSFMHRLGVTSAAVSRPRASATSFQTALAGSILHPPLRRYFIYESILRDISPEKVFLCDSRDLFFQSSPFEGLDDRLLSGAEPVRFGECPINTEWLDQIYPENRSHLEGKPVICSGATLGRTAAIRDYLRRMCDEMWRKLPLRLAPPHDQIIHNNLIYTGQVAMSTCSNDQGRIVTLHHEPVSNIGIHEDHITVSGQKPMIVHQWDRHLGMVQFVEKHYGVALPGLASKS